MSSQAWFDDPQLMLFTLSRYKFVSRIFRGFDKVLEIGCGDAFYSRIVQQQVRVLLSLITIHYLLKILAKESRKMAVRKFLF